MDRWIGLLNVSLTGGGGGGGGGCGGGGPLFRVAASLLLSPSSKTLAVPSVNAILFNGDRVEGTGDPVIEKLSDPRNVAEILVSKLGGAANAWVVDASTFAGSFAVYKELVPTVNSRGDPRRYRPNRLPASSSIVSILTKCVDQIQSMVSGERIPSPQLQTTSPRTIILGFSKGGVVVNQLLTELPFAASESPRSSNNSASSSTPRETKYHIVPATKERLLFSIAEFHYVDVGLNCAGAYLTDRVVIKKIADHLLLRNASIRFGLHGTPRQWCDDYRPWIRKEKDTLKQLLEDEARRCGGKLQVLERVYLSNKPPSLQMHFEIIELMDIS
ncbi:uncharacterized protein LOC109707042 [Ananas comosus]|uniref:Uncharacterized protein LOC109707042 n=1 Tax=Ananas comosus TaxID=4615 RepID=A0A6P5EJW2_ANACO|nr:uncharacterized protein LOC109707042 [Ananas comosus]XP_020083690.1 uncharacterized protein LOC109707042 [Ananas comosus]